MKYVSENEAEENFEELVNDSHPVVTIMGYDYDPARALRELDPVAYRQEYLNWLDALGLTTDEEEADKCERCGTRLDDGGAGGLLCDECVDNNNWRVVI